MIKRIKELDSNALIASKDFRDYVEKQETEINRGVTLLCILSILIKANKPGLYGYKIIKDLSEKTNEMLIIEEGTLYPILRKLENDKLIKSKREKSGRKRKFYTTTNHGKKIFNHLVGFYSKLIESISPLFDMNVDIESEKYFFCPLCANKIETLNPEHRFCEVCGNNIEKELKNRGLNHE